jgi:hypothetical protein
MSKYKEERDDLNQRLVTLPPETSIIARQKLQAELDIGDTNELRRQAAKEGVDLDNAPGVGPWESHPENPKIKWLPKQRQPEAIRLIESARSARRKERRDLLIKLAPVVIALLAFIVSVLALTVSVLTYLKPATH